VCYVRLVPVVLFMYFLCRPFIVSGDWHPYFKQDYLFESYIWRVNLQSAALIATVLVLRHFIETPSNIYERTNFKLFCFFQIPVTVYIACVHRKMEEKKRREQRRTGGMLLVCDATHTRLITEFLSTLVYLPCITSRRQLVNINSDYHSHVHTCKNTKCGSLYFI
jgi:hypothetical protein